MLLSAAKMSGLLSASHESFLRSLLQDGVASLLCVVFLFTPGPLATAGVVCVGLLLPAFRTSCTSSLVSGASSGGQVRTRYCIGKNFFVA
jgi:hypothetical protein